MIGRLRTVAAQRQKAGSSTAKRSDVRLKAQRPKAPARLITDGAIRQMRSSVSVINRYLNAVIDCVTSVSGVDCGDDYRCRWRSSNRREAANRVVVTVHLRFSAAGAVWRGSLCRDSTLTADLACWEARAWPRHGYRSNIALYQPRSQHQKKLLRRETGLNPEASKARKAWCQKTSHRCAYSLHRWRLKSIQNGR